MHWEYLGLKSNPFGITPDPKFLFLSTPHASAFEWMKMAIEQHEFGLITGEVGSGKTVLSRYLVDNLPEDKFKVAWIINPNMSSTQLLKDIYVQLFEKKPPYFKSSLINSLQEGFVDMFMNNRYPVVIIDEAQTIPDSKVFEVLRILSNYQTDEQFLISVLLFGQPELNRKLKRKQYRAFLQRIRFTLNLDPIDLKELRGYLQHRLDVAGANGKDFFKDEAIAEIYRLTEGYPRPLNHLASFAMMDAMSNEKKMVDVESVKSAAKSILYLEDKVK